MVGAVQQVVELSPNDEKLLVSTIDGVIAARGKVSLLALLGLSWGALRFFQALVIGINRAWGRRDYCWVSLSLRNLAMVGIMGSALFLGAVVPMVLDALGSLTHFRGEWLAWVYNVGRALVPSLVLFYGLLMLYRLAPRHKTRFSDVWIAALIITLLIHIFQRLFVFYAYKLANFNAIYGALGAVVILLMWIYITGMLILYGGCLCASGARLPKRAIHQRTARRKNADSGRPSRRSSPLSDRTVPEQSTLFDP